MQVASSFPSWGEDPNEKIFTGAKKHKYVSTRLVVHAGVTVAISLRRDEETKRLAFDYAVLDPSGTETGAPASDQEQQASQIQNKPSGEVLDSQGWSDSPYLLPFSNQVRVVGEEANPNLELPPVDRTGLNAPPEPRASLDTWWSTTLCLTEDVTDFEVLSDGKHIYLFRQSVSTNATSPSPQISSDDLRHHVDSNLLCDRYILASGQLTRPLEVRYRRSGQKSLMLNERDTLGVSDINDKLFYEPTFSLKFVSHLEAGRFAILRTPSMSNDIFRWMLFAYSSRTKQIDCFTCDVSTDGLFDLRGRVYYSCEKNHTKVFSTAPGRCTAICDSGEMCHELMMPIVPTAPLSGRAIELGLKDADPVLVLSKEMTLTGAEFADGCTIEAWVQPGTNLEHAPGSTSTIFGMRRGCGPSLVLDDKLSLALSDPSQPGSLLWRSELRLQEGAWNHVALIISGSTPRTAVLVANDEVSAPFQLSAEHSMVLQRVGSREDAAASSGFRGSVDEMRVWSYALDPKALKANRNSASTAMQPLLAACWHLDEGQGRVAHDSTENANHMHIVLDNPVATDGWTASQAPVRRNTGLTRQTLRLPSDMAVAGGLSAATYYEQVSVSATEMSESGSAACPQEGSDRTAANKTETKPLKRNARVLLCAVASRQGISGHRPLLVDFGLLSDGNLGGIPGELLVPSLSMAGTPSKASTSLIFIDPEGTELFAGFLAFPQAVCLDHAPCIWEAATGGVTLYLRTGIESFGALPYNITRSIAVGVSATLGSHEQIMAASKLRLAKHVTITTQRCQWADPSVAVDMVLSAKMQDNTSVISETWRGVPSALVNLCSIINGSYAFGMMPNAVVQSCEEVTSSSPLSSPTYTLKLTKHLTKDLPAATCLRIGTACVQTATASPMGSTSLLVTPPYSLDSVACKALTPLHATQGTFVFFIGYDYDNLVSCTGKGAGSFESGSSIVSLTQASSLGEMQGHSHSLIAVPAESTFDAASETPYFASLRHSTALNLEGDVAFSMFENVTTTDACPGLTFESWMKVADGTAASIAVAYTSEKKSRAASGKKHNEVQTFVLAVAPKASSGQKEDDRAYALEGSINDKHFRIDPSQQPLREGVWTHVACAYQNLYALRFDGKSHVDFGNAAEFNANEFSAMFHLHLTKMGGHDRVLLSKAASLNQPAPFQIEILQDGHLRFQFWKEKDENSKAAAVPLAFQSDSALEKNKSYKVFVSRKMVNVNSKSVTPRQGFLVTIKIWTAAGAFVSALRPPTMESLESSENDKKNAEELFSGKGSAPYGPVQTTDAPLLLGGASYPGIVGQIGGFKIWSTAVELPDDLTKWKPESTAKSLVGSYSFTSPDDRTLVDDGNRHHGKLRERPEWTSSPFSGDAKLTIYINGKQQEVKRATYSLEHLDRPRGPHQLTLGNAIHGDDSFRYLAARRNFRGEFDELRIWETVRSRESICDALCSRLTDVPPEMAVYLSFDKVVTPSATSGMVHSASILDESLNCWHLSVVQGGASTAATRKTLVPSGAPVGLDAACVTPLLREDGVLSQMPRSILTRPSVAEYGDLTIGVNGALEGSFKRAYAFVDREGRWVLVTGFKIGTLITEWFSQVQTAPTLKGYIEGAPPVPAENYLSRDDDKPSSAIRYINAQKCSYSYSSRREAGAEVNLSYSSGLGAKWEASAGMGVEAVVSEGEIKAAQKRVVDISASSLANEVSTTTSQSTMDMRVELTGSWTPRDGKDHDQYQPTNTGIALVESETADVFALRLKLQGPVKPLVAYQMRPNPDIPKDRNLVSFRINPFYTKQGCLDGRNGLEDDTSYPGASQAGPPKDVSYFKPAEAYALRDRIRRAEEQLRGEYERFSRIPTIGKQTLPKRTKRNICNSYVWTADGGTFQETVQTMDFTQEEVGGNANMRVGLGVSLDMEMSVSTALVTTNVDALLSAHYNMMLTKDSSSETSFELQAELPPAIDIRVEDPVTKQLVKRPGAVDTYRWMSFWLEPSMEATAAFFQQVVDKEWLEQSADPDAMTLRSLSSALKSEKADAPTKAWRVFHRCTYVNRVAERIVSSPAAAAVQAAPTKIFHDYAPSWQLISTMEPYLRSANSRTDVVVLAKPHIQRLWPVLLSQPRLYNQVIDMLVEYLGVAEH